jgi:hypothetical protein
MTAATATAETFDPAMTRELPEPARRWLSHAIEPGTPVTGYDRLGSGAGEMRWRLLRLIPVLTAASPGRDYRRGFQLRRSR